MFGGNGEETMAEDRNMGQRTGNFTPQELADPSKHQQEQIFEQDNRPQRSAPGVNPEADDKFQRGEDMLARGEASVGNPIGPDTSGAVAPPAARNRPGAATELGGTPGALSVPVGRDAG